MAAVTIKNAGVKGRLWHLRGGRGVGEKAHRDLDAPSPVLRTAAACCSAAMNSVYPARYDATERRRVQPSKIGAQGG
jgi:hypothetical protein